jgi:hypothetical protein
MDSPAKSARAESGRLYSALLHAYPASFRQHYSVIMQQTLDDMLQAEPSRTGRLAIWVRTLLDLPLSASKEQLTNGKGILMNRTTKYIITAALGAILIVGLSSFWFGSLHARQTMGVERVTAAQLADAMQQDHFYSDYGNAAVLFSGTASAVNHHSGTTLVTITTGRPYGLTCQFASNAIVKPGQIISIVAPAGSAERQAHGVLLHDCLTN